LLTGLSAFTPEGLTDIYDANGNVIFEKLIYDSVQDLAKAMISSEQYLNMFYIVHYFYIDKTFQTPRIYGKNLAYWSLVGKPNYTDKKKSYPVGTYFDGNMNTAQNTGFNAVAQQIALYLMNSEGWNGSSLTAEDIGNLVYPSRYETYFEWPHLKMPQLGPLYARVLFNQKEQSVYYADIPRRGKGEPRTIPFLEMQSNPIWAVDAIHKVDIVSDHEFKEVSYTGSVIWSNRNSVLGRPEKREWRVNRESKDAYKKTKEIVEKHTEKNSMDKWATSSILLFEMTNQDWFLEQSKGTWRYFIAKPFSQDFFSVEYGTDPYKDTYVYLLIEEAGKASSIQKVNLSTVEWPHLFSSSTFDQKRGVSGNFNLFSLPLSGWSSRFAKYLKSTFDVSNTFKIKFMLAKDGDGNHGYFLEPSKQYLTIQKTKVKGINQLRIKNVGS
jgi:hypothetical protein